MVAGDLGYGAARNLNWQAYKPARMLVWALDASGTKSPQSAERIRPAASVPLSPDGVLPASLEAHDISPTIYEAALEACKALIPAPRKRDGS